MPAQPAPSRDRIARLLLLVRGELRQTEAAARSGLSQPAISKAETGRATPRPEVAESYARALGAPATVRRELVELCRAAQSEHITSQNRIVRRGPEIQRRIRLLESQSDVIRSWQPEIVPGLLQSWDYTLAVIGRPTTPKWERERRARLALLDDQGRRFLQLVSEGVLRYVIGSASIMREQREHLITLSRRDHVRLGVLPFGPALPPPPPGFHLYADRMAVSETIAGTNFLDEHADLDAYRKEWERLDAAALHDDEARDLIAAIR